jgi:hypothetical protein
MPTASAQRIASWYRYTDARDVPDIRDRILRHVAIAASGCWIWTSAVNGPKAYPIITVKRMALLAHRLSLLVWKGDFDPRADVDHLCRTPRCVNPDHLEAVSHRDNVLRGESFAAENAARTHCRKGHAFDAENTRIDSGGHRTCRTCARTYEREFRPFGSRAKVA